MKRILSVFLSVLMLASLLIPAMGVSANVDTVDITDYTPVMPEQIARGILGNGANYGITFNSNSGYWRATAGETQPSVPSGHSVPMAGAYWVVTNHSDVAKDNTYVLSFKVRNKSADGVTPNLVYGLFDEAQGEKWTFTNQYVWAMEVPSADWTTVSRTFNVEHNGTANTSGSSYVRLKMGLGTGNSSNLYAGKENFDFRPGAALDFDINSVYFAKEAAYDVINTISMTKVMPGATVMGNAKVVNQVGDKGNLDQNITYFVTDADGNVKEGVSVVAGSNGSYTATVDENAADGDYVITARAAAYNTTENFMQQSVTLTVENVDYSDTNDIVTENLLGTSSDIKFGHTVTTVGDIATVTAGESATANESIARPAGGLDWTVSTEIRNNDVFVATTKVKKANSGNVNPNFIMGLVDATMGAKNFNPTYSFLGQYLNTQDIEDDTEWITVKHYMQIKNVAVDVYTPSSLHFVVGIGAGNTQNTYKNKPAFEFRSGASMSIDKSAVYLAKETLKGIANEAVGSTSVFPGQSISARARVVNNIDDTGSLDQTIEYIVLDSDTRKIMTNDITITEGTDGNYTINVGEDAAAGNYVAVASNTTNGTIVRTGLEFTVETIDKYLTEYEHGEKPKKIFAALSGTSNTTSFGNNGITENRVDGSITNTDIDYSKFAHAATFYGGLHGYRIDIAAADASSYSVREGDSYVVEFKVKNTSDEGITPKFGATLSSVQSTYATHAITLAMTEVTAREEHQTFKAVLTAKEDSGLGVTSRISIGMPWNNTQWFDSADHALLTEVENAKVNLDYGSVYVAKEVFYDVNVTADKHLARSGGSIVVDATALNQIGLEGALAQNFSWVALNSAKTDVAEGITITPVSGDSSKVNVAFDNAVEEGTYLIAAYSEDYDAVRHISITVSNKTSIENVAVDTVNKTVTFDAVNVAQDGFSGAVYVAEYNGDTYVKAEKYPFTLSAGNTKAKEVEYTLSAADGNNIIVYIWDDKLTPYVQPIEE